MNNTPKGRHQNIWDKRARTGFTLCNKQMVFQGMHIWKFSGNRSTPMSAYQMVVEYLICMKMHRPGRDIWLALGLVEVHKLMDNLIGNEVGSISLQLKLYVAERPCNYFMKIYFVGHFCHDWIINKFLASKQNYYRLQTCWNIQCFDIENVKHHNTKHDIYTSFSIYPAWPKV